MFKPKSKKEHICFVPLCNNNNEKKNQGIYEQILIDSFVD